jgi:hypothetical protein
MVICLSISVSNIVGAREFVEFFLGMTTLFSGILGSSGSYLAAGIYILFALASASSFIKSYLWKLLRLIQVRKTTSADIKLPIRPKYRKS